MITIGQLNKKVVFYFNYPIAKGAGFVDAYFELLTTKGYLKRNSGGKGFGFGSIDVKGSYTLYVKYQSYLESHLRSDLKLVIDGKSFKITDWELIEEKNFFYKLELDVIE